MSVLELRKELQRKLATMDEEDMLKMTDFADFLFFRKNKSEVSEKNLEEQQEERTEASEFTSVLIGEREVEIQGFDDLTTDQQESLKKSILRMNCSEKFTTNEELMKKYESWQEDLTEEQILSLKIGIAQSENPDQCISHEEITAKYNNLYGS